MRRLTLWDFVMWLRFESVNEVRELDSVLDEKYRNIIPDQIPDTLRCIKFHRKPTNIPNGILHEHMR